MKKILSVLLCILIVLTLACSCEKKEEEVVAVSGAEEVADLVGISFSIPDTAKYTSFSVIKTFIGEARFTFNSIVFVYCGSKVSAEESLHRVEGDAVDLTSITIDTRATVSVTTFEGGSRVATWNYGGTNYSLYAEKAVSDDTITELCDLLIK